MWVGGGKMNQRERDRLRRLNIKSSILMHYGKGKCACVKCGFSDIRALSIDHIEGNGAEHRKMLRRGGLSFYKWLAQNGFPSGYQTLCMNCQWIKSYKRDIPLSNTTKIAKRVRIWVENREQAFYLREVMIGLGLEEAKGLNVRVELHRLKKKGIIKQDTYPGHYKKCTKSVKVFNRTILDTVS